MRLILVSAILILIATMGCESDSSPTASRSASADSNPLN